MLKEIMSKMLHYTLIMLEETVWFQLHHLFPIFLQINIFVIQCEGKTNRHEKIGYFEGPTHFVSSVTHKSSESWIKIFEEPGN